MAVTTPRTEIATRFAPLLARARQRSSRFGRPFLASLTTHLGPVPDYDFALLSEQPNAFIWEQPSRGLTLAGVGHAVRLTAAGASRFEDVRLQLQRLLDEAVISQDSGAALKPAPLSFAGFAFDPEHPDDVAWFGFPDALAVLPRLLFVRSGAHLFLTVNLLASEDTDPSVVGDLAALAERLIAEAPDDRDLPSSSLLDPGPDAHAYWNESVRGLTAQIAHGEAEKVVLARRIQVESRQPGFDTAAVLRRLRARYSECTLFAVRAGDACFAGATPEMLISLNRRKASADCLAGSARRGATPEEDAAIGAALLADDKEHREHAFVARGLRESLGRLCSDVRMPAEPVLKRMANVQHLHTPIEATTNSDRHVLELVEALHPSAATAGLPRERSLCLIREQEPFSRGWYAGPIGWIDAEGGGEFAVALRSALLRDDVASLYAGCGIVTGSDPEREYAESEIKLAAMLYALNAEPGKGGSNA
ncbi:MAG TPA: isochorismate synthase [Dehalococcoidia bacterium]|nr:isochorismate synthase [Dehalococcoidia bacterium]